MPSPSLFSPEGLTDLLGRLAMALGGALARVFFAPGKTPRQGLATFAGCFVVGMIVAIAFRNVEWLASALEGLVALAALFGPEVFHTLRHSVPGLVRAFIFFLAKQMPHDDSPSDRGDTSG